MDASPLVAAVPLPASPLLLAGIEDFFWVIIVIISFIVWVYNQIKKANEDAAKKAQQTPPAEAQAPRRAQADASARRQQPPRKKQTTVRPVAQRPALSSAPSTPDDPWEQPEPVASHVRRHLDTQDFEQRSGGFGQLSQLDTEVDDHVHEAFDHEISTIDDQGAATEAERQFLAPDEAVLAASAAAGIAELFADPDRLRNAIILQEILRPPQGDELSTSRVIS